MNQGRIIVITGAPGTGKTTTASAVAKESDLEKSVHMHTDDFYHYHVRKPSAREYDDCCNEFWNVTPYVIGNLSSQVQQQIGKDFRGGVPVEAFARTMIQLFCKLGQSLCRKRNLIGVFGNVLPQQAVDLLV